MLLASEALPPLPESPFSVGSLKPAGLGREGALLEEELEKEEAEVEAEAEAEEEDAGGTAGKGGGSTRPLGCSAPRSIS